VSPPESPYDVGRSNPAHGSLCEAVRTLEPQRRRSGRVPRPSVEAPWDCHRTSGFLAAPIVESIPACPDSWGGTDALRN
jgi:hypothetical protein